MGQPKYRNDGDPRTSGPGFALTIHADTLAIPYTWRAPRVVFVNSMSDLFHPDVPLDFIRRVFDVNGRDATAHLPDPHQAVPSAAQPLRRSGLAGQRLDGRQRRDRPLRVPDRPPPPSRCRCSLRQRRAATGITRRSRLTDIDWLIAGGESGPGARRMEEEWVRGLRDQCGTSGVAFFFKQWGGRTPKPTAATWMASSTTRCQAHLECDLWRVCGVLDARQARHPPRLSDCIHHCLEPRTGAHLHRPLCRHGRQSRSFDQRADLRISENCTVNQFTLFYSTRIFELEQQAANLERSLRSEFPHREFAVIPGDCNSTIHKALADIRHANRAPTFAFIDPNGPDIHWTSLMAIARFKRRGSTKAEIWLLFPESMFIRMLPKTGHVREKDAARITAMYGSQEWRAIYDAG